MSKGQSEGLVLRMGNFFDDFGSRFFGSNDFNREDGNGDDWQDEEEEEEEDDDDDLLGVTRVVTLPGECSIGKVLPVKIL